jgi:hypothetical protein
MMNEEVGAIVVNGDFLVYWQFLWRSGLEALGGL